MARTDGLHLPGRVGAMAPWLVIAGLVVLQHAFFIGARDLWWSDEVRHGGVLLDLLKHGDWLALKLNGNYYPDKPPAYFWYLAGLASLFGTTAAWVIFLGLALSVLACLSCAHVLARRVTGSATTALVSVVLLATGPYFLMLSHYARMDFLFTAAICLGWSAFHAGAWERLNRRQIVLGFVWAAVAAMIKGPVGILLPVLALIGVALWRRRPALLMDRSVGVGLLVLVAVIGGWAGGIVLSAGPEYFAKIFHTQIVVRATDASSGPFGILRYALTLPLVMAPWSLLIFFRGRGTAPSPDGQGGTAYLMICAVTGFVALSLIGEKHEYYLLPIMVPLSILAAQVLVRLHGAVAWRFWGATAVAMIAIGAVFLLSPWLVPMLGIELRDMSGGLDLFWLPGLGLIGFGALLLTVGRRPLRVALGVFAIGQSLAINGTILWLIGALNVVLDPRHVTGFLRPYAERGYDVAIQHDITGVFAYHLGGHYTKLRQPDTIVTWLTTHPLGIVAVDDLAWAKISAELPPMEFVACTRFAAETYIILAQPVPAVGARIASGNGCGNPVQ